MIRILKNRIVILLIGVLFGYWFNDIWFLFFPSKYEIAVNKLKEVLYLTNKYYVEEIDIDTLSESGINGILEKLDPHSIYLPPQEHLANSEEMSGKFYGIGIEFSMIDDTLTVISAVPDGPSDKVGIQSGDKIIKVNSKSIIKVHNGKIISLLRGKKGSTVNLTVLRESIQDTINFNLKREEIIVHAVEFSDIIQDSVGYIKLVRFAENTFNETLSAINNLTKHGAKKIILDLRNNPGGYLDQAVKISDLFISDNKIIVSTKSRISSLNQKYYGENKYSSEKLPLIILVNEGSASASEIVAGAIQDWDRGIIIGEATFGKGLVQQSFVFSDDSEFRLTLAKYYTPSNRLIQKPYSDKTQYYLHDSTNNKNGETFFTKKGRKVVSLGGITPDVIVKNKEFSLSYLSLLKNNIYLRFVQKYFLETNKNYFDLYKDSYAKFSSNFFITEKMFNELLNYAKLYDNKIDVNELNAEKEEIKTRLKAEIARLIWNKKGWYKEMLTVDNQLNESLKKFSSYNKILK